MKSIQSALYRSFCVYDSHKLFLNLKEYVNLFYDNSNSVYMYICPICQKERQAVYPVRSREVCAECIDTYGTVTKNGYAIHFYVKNNSKYDDCFHDDGDSFFSVIDNTVYGRTHECFINNKYCYAYESNKRIVIVSAIPIPIRKP